MESLMNLAIPKPAAPPDPRLACGCDIAALVDQALNKTPDLSIIPVSALSGRGLDDLRSAIEFNLASAPLRSP